MKTPRTRYPYHNPSDLPPVTSQGKRDLADVIKDLEEAARLPWTIWVGPMSSQGQREEEEARGGGRMPG